MKTYAKTVNSNSQKAQPGNVSRRSNYVQFERQANSHISTLDRIANNSASQVVQKRSNPEEEEALQGRFKTTQLQAGPEEEEPLQGKFRTTQLIAGPEKEEPMQSKFKTTQLKAGPEKGELIQKKPNHTGLPDNLKTGIESLSGHSMDDVKVHYNSSRPANLGAHAYAQGTDIHLASGQEKHLPHEAWHVVQQKQGRVKPTIQMKGGVNVNDDKGMEKEADVMGARASRMDEGVNSGWSSPDGTRVVSKINLQDEVSDGCNRLTTKPAVLKNTGGTMQLFPINIHTHAYNWAGGNFAISMLGGGNMAALFRLTQNGVVGPGEVTTVIVKALEVDEPESVHLGETFLREMGFVTPADRIILPGTPEFNGLANKLGLVMGPLGQYMIGNKPVGGMFVMQDLGAGGADTIQSKMMSSATRAEIDEVFNWMTDPVVLDSVGKLIVYDSAIGNFDRITMDAQNFGNLMIRKGGAVATQVFLIDTNARLPHINQQIIAQANSHGGFYEERVMNSQLLKGIFAHKDWAIGNWFEAIPAMIAAQQNLREDKGLGRVDFLDQEAAYINQKVGIALAASRPAIEAGFDQAVTDLRAMLANKADPRRQAIKGAAQGGQSFATLKAQSGYLDARARPLVAGQPAGLGHDAAASITESYGRYRLVKATAALPMNQAPNPVIFQGLLIPARIKAGIVKQVFKGADFKANQQQDFAAFHPQYSTFKTDIEHHIQYLTQLKQNIDNVVKLRTSTAEPGSTRNQRAIVPVNKRIAQATRLVNMIVAPKNTALQWADTYEQKAIALIADLPNVSDRFNNLRNDAQALQLLVNQLQAISAEVRQASVHL